MRMPYNAWYALASDSVLRIAGGELDAEDLPDWDWYDAYADGVRPDIAAQRAIKAAGGF